MALNNPMSSRFKRRSLRRTQPCWVPLKRIKRPVTRLPFRCKIWKWRSWTHAWRTELTNKSSSRPSSGSLTTSRSFLRLSSSCWVASHAMSTSPSTKPFSSLLTSSAKRSSPRSIQVWSLTSPESRIYQTWRSTSRMISQKNPMFPSTPDGGPSTSGQTSETKLLQSSNTQTKSNFKN